MSTNRILMFLLVALLPALLPSLALAEVSARVDRTNLVEGETLTLELSTDDPSQSLAADFSELENDFRILDQRSESQIAFVNGSQSARVKAIIVLEPRRAGTLNIPALQFPDARTEAIAVEVREAPTGADGEAQLVYLELEMLPQGEDAQIYVNSQVSLVVRLLYQGNPSNAAISRPEPEFATVELLNEHSFSATRHGERYRGVERRYALFPERSGEFTLPPITFEGRIAPPSRDFWSTRNRGRRIEVATDPVTFEVLPRPADYPDQTWLPARSLEAAHHLSGVEDGIRVGEPLTRTLTIEAEGLTDNMLPEIRLPEIDSARIYPEAPERVTRVDDTNTWVRSRSTARFAVVPSEAGTLVLPELRIPWWNVIENRLEQLVVPAETIQVAPAAPGTVSNQPVATTDTAPAGQAVPAAGVSPQLRYWQWACAGLALAWLLTLLAWRRRGSSSQGQPKQRAASAEVSASKPWQAFASACRANDARGAAEALRRWQAGDSGGYRGRGLSRLAGQIDDADTRQAIIALDRRCYGPAGSGEEPRFDGAALLRMMEQWRRGRKQRPASKSSELPELYPAH